MPDTASPRARDTQFVARVMIVAAVVILLLLLWTWRSVVLLAFAAILIAVALDGLADPIARRTPLSRPWSLIVAVTILLAAVSALGWLFGAQIGSQMADLARSLPAAWRSFTEALSASPIGAPLAREVEASLSDGVAQSGVISRIGGYTLSFLNSFTQGLLVVFAGIFIAATPSAYKNGLLLLFPRRLRGDLDETLDAAGAGLKRWLLGTLVSMASMTVIVAVALWALGVPAFVALGLIAGVAQFIPVIGPLVATIPGALLALSQGPQTAAWTLLVYFAAAQVQANLIDPLIQKRAVSLPPAMLLFSVIAMGVLFGPLGVLLAAPLVVVLSIFVVKLYVQGVLHERVSVPGEGTQKKRSGP